MKEWTLIMSALIAMNLIYMIIIYLLNKKATKFLINVTNDLNSDLTERMNEINISLQNKIIRLEKKILDIRKSNSKESETKESK